MRFCGTFGGDVGIDVAFRGASSCLASDKDDERLLVARFDVVGLGALRTRVALNTTLEDA